MRYAVKYTDDTLGDLDGAAEHFAGSSWLIPPPLNIAAEGPVGPLVLALLKISSTKMASAETKSLMQKLGKPVPDGCGASARTDGPGRTG